MRLEAQRCERVDMTACMEAISMYNADYHRDRDNYRYVSPQEAKMVPTWAYVWRRIARTATSLTGNILMVGTGVAVVLILLNAARNCYDIDRAQPIVHTETRISPTTHQSFEYTWTEASRYPLPEDYTTVNMRLYAMLALGMVGCSVGSGFSLKRARKIHPGVPITRANTAHLSASESLVRASIEPMQAQEAVLLRATQSQDTPREQMLRAVNGEK